KYFINNLDVDINFLFNDNHGLIIHLIMKKVFNIVDIIIDKKISLNPYYNLDNVFNFSFHKACKKNDWNVMEYVYKNKDKFNIDYNIKIYGRTPLFIACENGHINIVKMLYNFNQKFQNDYESIMSSYIVACKYHYWEIVKFLIEKCEIDITRKWNVYGEDDHKKTS